jgi:uncharacterized membrane protein
MKFHIVFAGMWLINLAVYPVLRKSVLQNKNKSGEKKLIHLYLTFGNLFGMIGGLGIILTGIFMVTDNPLYGFFQFTTNHWLASKQVLMVLLLIILGSIIIPTSKKIRAAIGTDFEKNEQLSEDLYNNLYKLFKWNIVINLIVLINFLLAITHNFFV